jgi:hypothetical protein
MSTTLMELLHLIQTSAPVDFTYMGIGSAPHASTLEDYTSKWQQILPPFLQEDYTTHPEKTFRVIHFDPAFKGKQQFLQGYFESLGWGLVSNLREEMSPSIFCIRNHRMEILLVADFFYHSSYNKESDHTWFLEVLLETILRSHRQKFILQEYTGHEIDSLYQVLSKSVSKEKMKRQVLFDISYGTGTGCSTDLDVYKPFYDHEGNFINLLLMNSDELVRIIGQSEAIDKILRRKLYGRFMSDLNKYHVDYRRSLVGDPPLSQTYEYNHTTPSTEIMKILQRHLRDQWAPLEKLGILDVASKREMERLFLTYQTYNPYTWYTAVSKCLKLIDEEPSVIPQPQ